MIGTALMGRLVAAIFAVMLQLAAPALAEDANPFIGMWVLDVQGSNFQFDPPMKSATSSITGAPDGSVLCVADWVEANGATVHVEFSTSFSGKPDPIVGSKVYDSVVNRKLSSRSFKSVFLKDGGQVETEYHDISKDGKTLSVVESGVGADGRSWNYHLVFHRQ